MKLRAGVLISCAALAVSAPAAAAASLKVSVTPATVHKNEIYVVTITGRDRHRTQDGTPYLLAFIQYTGQACRRTATAEYSLPVSEWSWLFYPQRAETHPRIKHVLYERARTRYGSRRVCAYLYPTSVTPQTTAKPVARAGAPYSEVR